MSFSAGEPRTASLSAGEPRAAVLTEGMFSLFVVMALTDIVGKEQGQDRIERCKLLRNEDQVKFKLKFARKIISIFLDRPNPQGIRRDCKTICAHKAI